MRHDRIPLPQGNVRKTAARADVSLVCKVRQGTGPWKMARLSEISTTGFRIGWMPEFQADQPLRVRIAGMEPLSARVCWNRGKVLGCEFTRPLHVAVFEHSVAEARATAD